MSMRQKMCTAAACAALVIPAACGGGASYGGGAGPLPNTNSTAQKVAMAFPGISTLSTGRQTQSTSGTSVTLTVGGQVVGSGTLDAAGKVIIELTRAVAPGSTVTVTAGSTVVTFVIAAVGEDTAVMVQRNADGSLTVTTVAGEEPKAIPDTNDPDGDVETEDGHGNVSSVDANDGHNVLPANLPITVANTCSTVTITAKAGQTFSRLRFEENVRDGEGGSKLKFDGPFASPQTFALIAQSARLRIELFDSSGRQVLDVRAPVNAFTTLPGQATPSPCPSTAPTAAASASPQPTASPGV